MTIRIAINGFGRIGRMVLRAIAEGNRKNVQVVAINDLGPLDSNVHLFKYDSMHGRFQGIVRTNENVFDVGLGPIQVLAEPNPEKLPWLSMGVDLVMECTGRFANKAEASRHLAAGAKRVLVSTVADGADFTVVYGVNHDQIKAEHQILSNASCTTNSLVPVAYVLHNAIGIRHGHMTTIHAYTSDQRIVDSLHKDLRRARAVSMSMIPSSTNASKVIDLVLPELKGKLDNTAMRVPTANVSAIDFKFVSKEPTTPEKINQAILKAANGPLKGVLGTTNEPLVSIDFNHDAHSSNFDLTQTQVIDGTFCRVLSWYDNEWGFANRMCDVAAHIAKNFLIKPLT